MNTIIKGKTFLTGDQRAELQWSWPEIKKKLRIRMVDTETAKESPRFRNSLRKDFDCGLSAILTVRLSEDSGNKVRHSLYTNVLHNIFGITDDELFRCAMSNCMQTDAAIFMLMDSALLAFGKPPVNLLTRNSNETVSADDFYVLTTESGIFGANTILYEHCGMSLLERIGYIIGKNYYLLPSSIHELIILPVSTRHTVEELSEMVKDVNQRLVSERNFLSDHVFFFDREKKALTVAL